MKINLKRFSFTLEELNVLVKKSYASVLMIIAGLALLAVLGLGYQYLFRTVRTELKTDIQAEEINQSELAEILGKLETRQKKMEQVWRSQYPDPFR